MGFCKSLANDHRSCARPAVMVCFVVVGLGCWRYLQKIPHPSNYLCLAVDVDIVWSARQQERVGGIAFSELRDCPSMPCDDWSPRLIEFYFLGGTQVPVPGLPCSSRERSEDAKPRYGDARPVGRRSRSDAGVDLGRD